MCFWRDEGGWATVTTLFFLLVFIFLLDGLADIGQEIVLRTQLHYAVEDALDAAAQQTIPNSMSSCIILDSAKATLAFQDALMAELNSSGLVAGPGVWNYGGTDYSPGPVEVMDFQPYNTNQAVLSATGPPSCQQIPPLGQVNPSGTVIDRPSVYAEADAPVTLFDGRQVTLHVEKMVGANPP